MLHSHQLSSFNKWMQIFDLDYNASLRIQLSPFIRNVIDHIFSSSNITQRRIGNLRAAFINEGFTLNQLQNQISDLASSKVSSLGLHSTSLIVNSPSTLFEHSKSPDLINQVAINLETNFENLYAESNDEQAAPSLKSRSSKLRLRQICTKFSDYLKQQQSLMLEQTEAANGADYIASNKTDSLQVLVIVQEAQTLEARSLSDLLYTCAELQSPQPAYGPLLSTAAGSTGTFLRVRFGFLFLGISPDDIEQRLRVSLECASFSLPSPRQIIERVLERVLLGPLSQLCRTGANACGSGEDSTVFSPAADADAEADSAVSPRLLLSPSLLLFLRDVFESTAFSLNAFQLTFEWLLYVHFKLRDSAVCSVCLDLDSGGFKALEACDVEDARLIQILSRPSFRRYVDSNKIDPELLDTTLCTLEVVRDWIDHCREQREEYAHVLAAFLHLVRGSHPRNKADTFDSSAHKGNRSFSWLDILVNVTNMDRVDKESQLAHILETEGKEWKTLLREVSKLLDDEAIRNHKLVKIRNDLISLLEKQDSDLSEIVYPLLSSLLDYIRDSISYEKRDELFWLSETDLIRSLALGTRALPSLLDRAPLERLAARTLELFKRAPRAQLRLSSSRAEATSNDHEETVSRRELESAHGAAPKKFNKLCSMCRQHADPLSALYCAAERGPDVVLSNLTHSLHH